jgi:hypothetical protein
MHTVPATISLVPLAARATACDLCAADGRTITMELMVQHPRGGAVQFAACNQCVSAVRRIAAAAGQFGHFVLSDAPGSTMSERPGTYTGPTVLVEVLQEYATLVRDADGRDYVARACGGQRPDGTWIGWVEFHPLGGGLVWRTDRETTQSNRAALAYWASGLEPEYLAGAFARAQALAKAV